MTLDPNIWGGLIELPDFEATVLLRGITGFRICRVVEDEQGKLWLTGLGLGQDYRWKAGRNEAACLARKGKGRSRLHPVPSSRCTCGLWAVSDLIMLVRMLGPQESGDDVILCGVVGGGRVQVHESGFRAQYAQIVAICQELPGRLITDVSGAVLQIMSRPGLEPEVVASLGQSYRARLCSLRQLASFTKEFDRGSR